MAKSKGSSYILQKTITLVFYIILILLVIIFIYQNITYDVESVLKKSKSQYVIFSTLVLVIELLPFILAASVIISFGFLYSIGRIKNKTDINDIDYVIAFFIFLIFAFVFSVVLNEGVKPLLDAKVSEIKIITKLSYQYLKKAKELELAGKYDQAITYYKKYLTFEPKNTDVIDLVAELERKKYSKVPKPQQTEVITAPPTNAANLYNLALYYTKTKEYILAIYYLERYLRLAPNDSNAKQLYDKVKDLYQTESLSKNNDKIYIMQQKKLGIKYIEEKKYVEAYKLFTALHKKYPDDKSVLPYLEEATNLYKKLDFFVSDAAEKIDYPGLNSLLFKLNDAKKDQVSYLVYIEKVVYYFDDIYLFDIHIYNLDTKETAYYKYGKKIQTYFIFKSTDQQHVMTYFDVNPAFFKNIVLYETFDKFPLYTIFSLKKFITDIGYSPILFTNYIKNKIISYLCLIFSLVVAFKLSYIGMKKTSGFGNIFQIIFFMLGLFLLSISFYEFILLFHNGLFTLFSLSMLPSLSLLLIFGIDLIIWVFMYFA